MTDLWVFLGDPHNQAVLGWLGGGLLVLAGGAWTVVKFFAGRGGDGAVPDAASRPGSMEVLADRGGIAAGRDASVRTSHGLSGLQAALIVAVVAGAVLLAGSLLGRRITASNCGVAVGGGVSGSVVTANCPTPAGR